jgi:hypothetical protein
LWLKRYVNPIQESKDYIEWNKFLDKHTKQSNKSLPTSNKTDEESIEFAENLIDSMKRSRS